jgi:hypothetical protein
MVNRASTTFSVSVYHYASAGLPDLCNQTGIMPDMPLDPDDGYE